MNKKDRKHLKRLEVFIERLLITMYASIVLFVCLVLYMVHAGSIHL